MSNLLPSVALIRTSAIYTEVKLDKNLGNYKEWYRQAKHHLTITGLISYALGTARTPDPTDIIGTDNWEANDNLAQAVILSTLSKEEWDFAEPLKGAKACWDGVIARHQNEGPIRQVQLLQEALSLQCSKATPLTVTASQICTAIARAFEMGQLTQDLFTCIALLNSLSDFPHLRSLITRDLSESTASTPYSSGRILTLLENEQRIITSDQKRNDAIVLASQAATPKRTICSNCKKPGHGPNYCVAPGGGMSGRTVDEAKDAQRKDKDSKRKQSSGGGKFPINIKGADGKIYTAYMESPPPDTPTPAFAAIADAGVLPKVPEDDAEYLGWVALDEEPNTLVNWGSQTKHAVSAAALQAVPTLSTVTSQCAHPTAGEDSFWLDTGATVHISPNAGDFHSLRKVTPRLVRGLGGSSVTAIGIGDIRLNIGRGDHITLHNALYIPEATVRLISVRCLALDSNVTAHFNGLSCWLTNTAGNTIIRGSLSNNKLYSLSLKSPLPAHVFIIHNSPDIATWHRRLGHANYRAVTDMITHGLIPGLSSTSHKPVPKCDSCVLGKQTKTSVPKTRGQGTQGGKATRRLEKVWVDLSGPHDVVSRTGGRYVMNIVDDYTSFVWSIILKNKSDAFPALQIWERARENETGLKVGIYRMDNGELRSNQVKEWLESRGTVQQFTAPYTSAHIGRVERLHRTLMGKARAMRLYSGLPPQFWDEFYLTASHVHAKTTSMQLRGTTPWQLWHGRTPDLSYLREPGCRAFVLILNKNNPKIYERSIECILLGYNPDSKTYRCYDPKTRQIYSSYHVNFLESHDGYLRHPSSPVTPLTEAPMLPKHVIPAPQQALSDDSVDPGDNPPPAFQGAAGSREAIPDASGPEDPGPDGAPIAPDRGGVAQPRIVAPLPGAAGAPADLEPHPEGLDPQADGGVVPLEAAASYGPGARRSTRLQQPGPSRADRLEAAVKDSAASNERARAQRVARRAALHQLHAATGADDLAVAPVEGVDPPNAALAGFSCGSEANTLQLPLDDEAGATLRSGGGVAPNDKPRATLRCDGVDPIDEALATLRCASEADVSAVLAALPRLPGAESDYEADPLSWDEARRSAHGDAWRASFAEELASLKQMGVYQLVPLDSVPPGCRIHRGKPVFHVKRDANGLVYRRKTRLVFRGFEQIHGRDFDKTTSPTARMESWRILLHLAAHLGWDAQQIDIKTAFLYGLLPDDETQYMYQPTGFEEPGKINWVWKLVRSLYGMKQAGRIWNRTLHSRMLEWGFKQLSSESCVYFRKAPSGTILAAVHVDDFLSVASSHEENERFKEQMRQVWSISDPGDVRFVVGIAVEWDRPNHTVMLSQMALIDRIVSQFGQSDASPLSMPMAPGLKLRRVDPASLTASDRQELTKLPYRSLVGSLLYLAVASRPDISYSVQQLSQYLDCFSYTHWNAAIRVVRYLKGTRSLRLHLGGSHDLTLTGYSDSDWANCLDTRRSVGGYAFSLGSGIVSWNARKQKTVAASSCEAEYVAAFNAAKENSWLRMLFHEIGFTFPKPTTIRCDNNAAICLSEDPLLHERVKHIDIKYHFLRERAESGELKLLYINTKDNLADLFTKALEGQQFTRLRGFLGLREVQG
jgi:transposase InsO family protein